uniref:PH domain-containing protein n=1 Tax=Nothobranchius furzeri TaxID=105023 RepID=A0A8C6LM33_NOTFU
MQPDLLNFKKGWMMKLDEKDQWKKYWFVLSTDRLRFYSDSVAEETSDLGGEIDLTKCFSVSECQVQRNYGFQIHTLMGTFTLSAMTAGIRRNWIQALMKNVHPGNAPDVASLPGQHITCSSPELIPKPDVTQDSASKDISVEKDPHSRTVTERRHEDHYKTFDCSEIRPQSDETDHQKPLPPLELGDLERRRRREERRRRYESMLGFSLGHTEPQQTEDGDVRALSPQLQLRMEKQIEECWRKVERSGFIPERKVLLSVYTRDSEADLKRLKEELKEELEKQRLEKEERNRRKTDEEQILQVTEGMAVCERGLAAMEECHRKVVEELRRLHQQEVERLLVEKDQLLEEESAATATAIEAIQNAHRVELQREVQRRRQSENGNTQLEEIHRQHREELASVQRELGVLSQQFSLKCLEIRHLVQALDAERRALCQCQQENQDLRSRNQVIFSSNMAHVLHVSAIFKNVYQFGLNDSEGRKLECLCESKVDVCLALGEPVVWYQSQRCREALAGGQRRRWFQKCLVPELAGSRVS